MIKRPYLSGYCEKCKNHYLLEDESRCKKMKVGQSDVACVQVKRCEYFAGDTSKQSQKGGAEE